jgi:hypothetical protein
LKEKMELLNPWLKQAEPIIARRRRRRHDAICGIQPINECNERKRGE